MESKLATVASFWLSLSSHAHVDTHAYTHSGCVTKTKEPGMKEARILHPRKIFTMAPCWRKSDGRFQDFSDSKRFYSTYLKSQVLVSWGCLLLWSGLWSCEGQLHAGIREQGRNGEYSLIQLPKKLKVLCKCQEQQFFTALIRFYLSNRRSVLNIIFSSQISALVNLCCCCCYFPSDFRKLFGENSFLQVS